MKRTPWKRIALVLCACLLSTCSRPAPVELAASPRTASGKEAQRESKPVRVVARKVAAPAPAPAEPVPAGEGFPFPADARGQELARCLRPGGDFTVPPLAPAASVPRPVAPGIADPAVPLPVTQVPLATHTPLPPAGVPRPRTLAEDMPLVDHTALPILPGQPVLAVGPPVRWPHVEVNRPIPLPVIPGPAALVAQAPVDDPTWKASRQATRLAQVPVRSGPEPFRPENLPDPFEHRRAAQLRTKLAESPDPLLAAPRVPGR